MPKSREVDVCVATYRRPRLLKKLLLSLLAQELDDAVSYRIVVVDNDASASARQVVMDVSAIAEVEVIYDVEPEQNISLARNRAISLAKGDMIAFIDDDEYAEPDWLQKLLDAVENWQADAVFGPVITVYPPNTPGWIKRGGFFERARWSSGTIRPHGGTGNVLITKSAMSGMKWYFDPEYGLSGGGDTDFFSRMHNRGAKLIWCDNAVVYEEVPASRMTLRWMMLRAFRGGQSHSRVYLRHMGAKKKLIWVLKKTGFLAVLVAFAPFSIVGGRVLMVKTLQRIFASVGHLTSLSGLRYLEYQHQ
ncbi:MAG TPA: glycosyltransferase [Gammaproteobacteria bacterium]|nr:glycosyltransferase [Gammaproteobacteria bacterium]